ncbi:CUB domain-containing protein 2-like [Limulus polyphemus]|uniref:CUB domain-containing protein 2-like n=1 Tax=Limulus polyphemus TaxID=6850 RepID=A0ABM1TCR8_LIMPO|nr:CUB domain-containing protein 2-like [Limulus polyphemus]
MELTFMYLDAKIRLSKRSLAYMLIIFYFLHLVKEVNGGVYYCDEQIRSHDAELQSPNFPWSYLSNLRCRYTVYRASPEVCKLEIHILYFRLEKSSNCFNDHLILEGKIYCGEMLRPNQVITFDFPGWKKEFKMYFRTNNKVNNIGFRLRIQQQIYCTSFHDRLQADQESESCDIRILSPVSHLRSPGYPWAYPPNLRCRYTVEKFVPSVCQASRGENFRLSCSTQYELHQ